MKEYFNGFSTQDLVDMRRNDEKRKEKVEMEKEIERLHSITKEVRAKLYDLNYKIKEIYNVPFDISEIFEIIDLLDKEKE